MRRGGEHLDFLSRYLIPPDGRGPTLKQPKHAMRVVLGKKMAVQGGSNAGMRCDTTCLDGGRVERDRESLEKR